MIVRCITDEFEFVKINQVYKAKESFDNDYSISDDNGYIGDYSKKYFKIVEEEEMNINEKIQRLEKELSELKAQVNKKPFSPKDGETFFIVQGDGLVFEYSRPDGHGRYIIRNRAFSTREQAEFFTQKELVLAEIQRYADEHNEGEIDWSDDNKEKWEILYNNNIGKIDVASFIYYQTINSTCFTSNQTALDCIESVGEDRIKKYLFGKES